MISKANHRLDQTLVLGKGSDVNDGIFGSTASLDYNLIQVLLNARSSQGSSKKDGKYRFHNWI